MTEKEAWLRLAEIFGADGELPTHFDWPLIGICSQTKTLVHRRSITRYMQRRMIRRLDKYFNPNGFNPESQFFWLPNTNRPTRTLRATACCFLAAMCDPLTRLLGVTVS